MEKSILDIIAQSTAKSIEDVSKIYHETYSGDEPKAGTASCADEPDTASDKEKAEDATTDTEPPFFRYGTPFTDIMRFTRDVEVFTRHIDARTRGDFGRGDDEKDKKK